MKVSASQKPAMDKAERWGCAVLIIGFILLIVLSGIAQEGKRTTLKFYNLDPHKQLSLVLIAQKEHSDRPSVYQLPAIPYKYRVELRIPALERHLPIQILYSVASHQVRCARLEKQYGDWQQMDAIWVNPGWGLNLDLL